ncbi:MAG TPA: FHA domain-containing protein [Gemmatimonadaceae bacterium]|nr:FHA domain-containing protein [Gemmatimonadaceae bacterium]
MPYIQLEGQQYPLVSGENAVGAGASAQIRLPGGGVEEVSAVLVVGADGGTIVRRGGEQGVKVNGVALGAEPSPLLHGDKIEIAGRELFFGDDRKGGNTQYVPNVKLPQSGASSQPPKHKPTAATGGRLISLVDGREYAIPVGGLVLGRDPTCDVVVSSSDVSRKHAVIAASPDGYTITDTSTNGVTVNGARITAPVLLGKGDLIVIGTDEFRFHADSAAAAPAAAAASASTSAAASARPVLATLEVTSSGMLHGKKFEIRSPLTHVGRGAHNDIVISDESVSDSHAKVQKRETGWFVVDMGSTNGTYVGGKRIAGEQELVGAPDLRLGGVKFIFRAGDAGEAGGAGQTRAIATLRPSEGAKARATAKQPGGKTPSSAATPPRVGAVTSAERTDVKPPAPTKGLPVVVWILGVLALGALVLYLLAGR